MRCRHVNILLADYRDKNLSSQDMASVKEHLAQCAGCREEYQFLKKYRNGIDAFPVLDPPDNFLEKIHERITAGERRGLIRKLFYPLKIKLPLEAAGVLALTLIIAFIYRPFAVNRMAYRAEETAAPAASTVQPEPKKTHPEGDFDRSTATVKRDDEIRAKERAPAPHVAESAVREEPYKAEITLALRLNRVSINVPSVGESFQAKNLTEAGEPRAASEKDATSDKKEKSSAELSRGPFPAPRDQPEVDGIAALAKSLAGKVVKTTYDEKTGFHRQVIVEIPARNYDQFLTGLRADWIVHKQSPAGPHPRARRMQIIMNFSE
ncbi:MAG: hypothetical protein A2176_10020 [Spirochaetes bacterium RBG_13_51_14]|nr:MAG: hypothetical protein A2176_10020 [Spirochaetes bacterium RBG_13_51_14]